MVKALEAAVVEEKSYLMDERDAKLLDPEDMTVYTNYMKRDCSHCQAPEAVQHCSRCKYYRYCSRECQAAAWSTHKVECARLKKTKRTLWNIMLGNDGFIVNKRHSIELTRVLDSYLTTHAEDKDILSLLGLFHEFVQKAAVKQGFNIT
jgi:hypothetical protein